VFRQFLCSLIFFICFQQFLIVFKHVVDLSHTAWYIKIPKSLKIIQNHPKYRFWVQNDEAFFYQERGLSLNESQVNSYINDGQVM